MASVLSIWLACVQFGSAWLCETSLLAHEPVSETAPRGGTQGHGGTLPANGVDCYVELTDGSNPAPPTT